ncbi:MAG: tetraacyldisaccharide 4'-kinase [Tannerella sp.]|nr:tetraacyldisaccharide 4'-kinase [Tannerella sp.]
MAGKLQKLRILLRPFSLLYGIGVWIRNLLFDGGLLPTEHYEEPVICVGNLAVGGSGKTPMVEYLIRLLQGTYRVGVLSRGYRRETSGFVWVDSESTAQTVGDESCQIKYKYPQTIVAVDENRRRGIRKLLSLPEDQRPQVILLDDGFQHRYVQPSFSILLTGFHHLYYTDQLLPAGRLREPASAARRANIIVVSKCEKSLSSIESRIIRMELRLKSHQSLFFSSISYLPLKGVFSEAYLPDTPDTLLGEDGVLLLTGIATPALLIAEIRTRAKRTNMLSFADHHAFRPKDIRKIQMELKKMKPGNPPILCTEKDAARIRNNPYFPEEWRSRMYYVPIEIEILFNNGEQFNELVLRHIYLFKHSKI